MGSETAWSVVVGAWSNIRTQTGNVGGTGWELQCAPSVIRGIRVLPSVPHEAEVTFEWALQDYVIVLEGAGEGDGWLANEVG